MNARSLVQNRQGAALARRIAFFCALACFWQTRASALTAARPLSQSLHRIWQVQQGLPQATIYCIRQDRAGYLWLGTQTGLFRFDGVRFTSAIDTYPAMPANQCIRDIVDDPALGLWLATDSGLFCLHKGQVTHYSASDGLPSDAVRQLLLDAQGKLWACTSGGAARFENGKFVAQAIEAPNKAAEFRALCQSKDEKLWFGGDGEKLSVWNGSAMDSVPLQSAARGTVIRALLIAPDGAIWIGGSGGLLRYFQGQERLYTIADGLADNSVYCLAQGREGVIWAGTKAGFSRIRTGEIETFRAKDGLSQSTVYTLIEDREGSLWVGTKHGLNQFLDRRTLPFTASEGLASNNTGPVLEDGAGKIWVATLDAGLCHFDGRGFTTLTAAQGLPSNAIRALAQGADGALWIGGDRGVARLSQGRIDRVFTTAQGLPADDIRALVRDADGTLWAGTSAGVAFMRDGRFISVSSRDTPFSGPVAAMAGLRDGSVLIAAEGAEVYRYAAGKLDRFSVHGSAPVNVSAFYEDADGLLWMGTLGGGLLLAERDRLVRFSVSDGLFDDEIYAVLADDQGRLWMACSKGLFYVERGDLLKFSAGKIRNYVSTPFSPTDALRTIECKAGVQPAAWRMSDGRLWFSTIRGAIVIDPTRLRRSAPPAPVSVEAVIVNGKAETPDAIGELPPGVKNLEFRYTALSFLSPARITFKYMLEGFDREWIEAGSRREAYYTNLPPGHFRFRVAASNVDGSVNEASPPVAFILAPHFYQHVLFWPACAAALGLGALAAYRVRVRWIKQRLEGILAERSRIARELHDTLVQGFSGVTMEMQALSTRLPAQSGERATLQEIIGDAGNCLREARQSVAGLRGAAGEGAGLSAALVRSAKQLTETHDVRLKLRVDAHGVGLPADVEYNLLRIVSEAIANAVKHAAPSVIEVSMESVAKGLVLRCDDDGCGFDAREEVHRPGHYGLVGMKERAAQIGAHLQVKSQPGRGTSVVVTLASNSDLGQSAGVVE